jgi:hypothetical protein
MRTSAILTATTALLIGTSFTSAQSSQPPILPAQLVREVVYTELHDHSTHGYWRFRVTSHTQGRTLVADQVETLDGPVSRIALADGKPLSPEYLQEEDSRLLHLLHSPAEQEQQRRQHQQDEQRIGHILGQLPDAFLFDNEGQQNGCYRLRFRPNPAYSTSSIEGRVFQEMSGTIMIDVRSRRLALLEGHMDNNVDFGFGILGRVYKGGWFLLQRTRVSPTEWKTERLEIHMNIRALMVKSFTKETSETREDFVRVSANTTLVQGVRLLEGEKSLAPGPEIVATVSGPSVPAPARNPHY